MAPSHNAVWGAFTRLKTKRNALPQPNNCGSARRQPTLDRYAGQASLSLKNGSLREINVISEQFTNSHAAIYERERGDGSLGAVHQNIFLNLRRPCRVRRKKRLLGFA
jgi:hypothetical protein